MFWQNGYIQVIIGNKSLPPLQGGQKKAVKKCGNKSGWRIPARKTPT